MGNWLSEQSQRPAVARGPRPAIALGIGGLIPFVVLVAVVRLGPMLGVDRTTIAIADSTLCYYAAAILTFMGGAQWGLAMARPVASWRAYAVSVLPSLAAVGVLMITTVGAIGVREATVMFAIGFAVLLAYDLWTVRSGEAPAWYGPLRIALTAIVVAALLVRATG